MLSTSSMIVVQEALRRGPVRATLEMLDAKIEEAEQLLLTGVLLANERRLLELQIGILKACQEVCCVHIDTFSGHIAHPLRYYIGELLNINRPFAIYTGPLQTTYLQDTGEPGPNGADKYELERRIHRNDGDGREIWDAFHVNGGRLVVIKKVPKTHLQGLNAHQQSHEIFKMRREFASQIALRKFDHANVLCLEKYFENQSDIFAVFPRADESLFDLAVAVIREVRVLHSVFAQMTAAVSFLAGIGFVHRDLKLENFVVYHEGDQNVRVQMIDFGWTTTLRLVDPEQEMASYRVKKGRAGTVAFMAPEVFAGGPYTYDALAAEVWSLGACFFALGCGAQPYRIPNMLDNGFRRIHSHGARKAILRHRKLNAGVIFQNQRLMNLVNRMMVSNAASRISIPGIVEELDHPQTAVPDPEQQLATPSAPSNSPPSADPGSGPGPPTAPLTAPPPAAAT
ncbi:Protein kinase, putative [Hondaea fermentalgiana]|uniref:Protein kinase, putative n=1 Tax=Hondaea fermentalgiana TaxID=2315210 RepID=A0A2R5G791_9STRA|nr:Protein kinase, putative [Hondaea fermentalgiana]|eukprot:GBG24323.1 Protein kinase, putative [Hondaea fermentalgiana]